MEPHRAGDALLLAGSADAWWDAFHPGELITAAVRRDGLLVGLAPFQIEDGALGRRLLPLGLGVSDDVDVLSDGARVDEVAAAIVDADRHRAMRWDGWSLEEWAPDALASRRPEGPLLGAEHPGGDFPLDRGRAGRALRLRLDRCHGRASRPPLSVRRPAPAAFRIPERSSRGAAVFHPRGRAARPDQTWRFHP